MTSKSCHKLYFSRSTETTRSRSSRPPRVRVRDVPPTATTIQLGFVLVGDGAAWLDTVSLDPVPGPCPARARLAGPGTSWNLVAESYPDLCG